MHWIAPISSGAALITQRSQVQILPPLPIVTVRQMHIFWRTGSFRGLAVYGCPCEVAGRR